MRKRVRIIGFHSTIGWLIEKFIQEKRACGYKYITESDSLRSLDRFLCEKGLRGIELPRGLVEQWISKRPQESFRTHRARIGLVRRLADFIVRQGYTAYIPDARLAPMGDYSFVPRIFTYKEIRKLLKAVDSIRHNPRSPWRHLIMPEIFRVLYSCGLRVGEVLRLRVDDVNLDSAVLTIRQSKFRKDRLVPFPHSLSLRLQRYANLINHRASDAIFFPAPDTGPYHRSTIYHAFRQLLWQSQIPHGGQGKGPRLHDLRHTYAVHRLVQWYRESADIHAKLPVLATYMGHQSFTETQRYIQLTADIFPDLSVRLEKTFGYVIPRRIKK